MRRYALRIPLLVLSVGATALLLLSAPDAMPDAMFPTLVVGIASFALLVVLEQRAPSCGRP